MISTVCIYPGGTSPDETTPLGTEGLTPYGANRLHMQVLSESFETLVLRLPQLYGTGLKKGIVYDLLNYYRVEYIWPDGRFQYYDLRRISADTQVALEAGIEALYVATSALTSSRVAAECFGIDLADQVVMTGSRPWPRCTPATCGPSMPICSEGHPGYLMDETAEIAGSRSFVRDARALFQRLVIRTAWLSPMYRGMQPMYKSHRVSAIITCAGRGVRFGSKLLVQLGGVTVLEKPVREFVHPAIDEIIVTVPENQKEYGRFLIERAGLPVTLVGGGEERF